MQERPHTWDQHCQGLLNTTGKGDVEAVTGKKTTHTQSYVSFVYACFIQKKALRKESIIAYTW